MPRKLPNISSDELRLLKASPMFDEKWYLARYPDVRMLDMDPAEHFLWIGHALDRNPSAKFDLAAYRDANHDVKSARINPLIHYLKAGVRERRPIYPVADAEDNGARKPCKRRVNPYHTDWDTTAHDLTIKRLQGLPAPFTGDKVSIVMPTWNRGKVISTAIQSVLAQTHKNFELIVIDDHSTDETAKSVAAVNDPRIIYKVNAFSKGVSGARNTGLEMATGEWVFFLDSDNSWKPTTVEFLLKHAADAQASAGYCAANMIDDSGIVKRVLYADFDFESCLRNNFVDLNCFFMRWSGAFRDFRFDESFRRLVDWDLILRVANFTRVVGLPYVGVEYYDGNEHRITNKEHVERNSIIDLQNRIREKARRNLLDPPKARDASSFRIAVHLHVFHPDRVPECIDYLRNIRTGFDLFVTTSLDESHESIALLRRAFPEMRLLLFPNVGADIAPFLELVSTFKFYELVLKIHTKRDVDPWGDAWRRGLMAPLAGSAAVVDSILEKFQGDDNLVMACGADFYKHGVKNSIPAALRQATTLAGEFGLSAHLDKDWAFVAGTMFWIRPQTLLKVSRRMCDSDGYSASFTRDGAIEHGLERIFGLALWENPLAKVATISMAGEIRTVGLGEGFLTEGVAQTMKRLHG